MIKEFYEEYLKANIRRAFKEDEGEWIIYKGFKITKTGDQYVIQDVRRSDLYDPVKVGDMRMFRNHGFIKGADLIMLKKDKKRSRFHKRKIEFLYRERRIYESNPPKGKTKKFIAKKIRNINKNIHLHADEFFFVNTRIEQVEKKYQ